MAITAALLLLSVFGGPWGGRQGGPPLSRFGSSLYVTVASADPEVPLAEVRAVLEVENAGVA